MKPVPQGLKARASRPGTGTLGRQAITKLTGEGKGEKREQSVAIFPWSMYEN